VPAFLLRLLDAAFGHPRGLLGRLGGAVMARGNAGQERRAVGHASLRAGERLLVPGPGPGLGPALAAAVVGPDGHVLGSTPERLRDDAVAAGFADVHLAVRPRRLTNPAVELVARRAGPAGR
jgi:arsenite methyltransferase